MGDTGAAVTERHDCLSAGARVARAAVVYRFFDADDTLLYIGVTSDFPLRLEQHKRQSAFGPSIDSYTLAYYTTRAAADHAERAAILDECPAGNSRVRVKRKMPPGPVPQPLATTRKLVCIRLELDRDTYRHRSVSAALAALLRQEETT